jgi:hypothetical protein
VTTAANIVDSATELSHPDIDGDPDAILLVTVRTRSDGPSWATLENPFGVEYSPSAGLWRIFLEDGAAMPGAIEFVVSILPPAPGGPTRSAAFVHRTTPSNTHYNYSHIDHPLANDNPDALVFETHVLNPGGGPGGRADLNARGVWYDARVGRWAIFHQDTTELMRPDVTFNVFVTEVSRQGYTHLASAGSISGHATILDHPVLNGAPGALLHVSQVYRADDMYNAHRVGVWFLSSRWTIIQQDLADMPPGRSFNVWMP